MSQNDLLSYLRRRPFLPFRIVTSDGTNHDVHHPELVLPTPTTAVVGYPHPEEPRAALRFDLVSIRHIVRLEDLPAEVAGEAEANGA